ncbi:peptidylprolyl isomerase [Flavobacterium psychrotrophum]|uniref:peptidylprolyl isomerase n=1 Tax=Flavobacterium psychrotrophum TaxID=2294119 RepID=UPI000E32274C|nr:peptidylprolyl isomerase [Flavobacterium psychrotrophum]
MQKQILLLLLSVIIISCKGSDSGYSDATAPDTFTATFETTKGNFEVEIKKAWSPKAADRFYNLIESGFYNNTLFYRVVPGFVAQCGSLDAFVMKEWEAVKVPDEPVLHGNKRGTVTFARSGKESRGLDMFINLYDNTPLDTINYEGVKGYPAFGTVTKGMDVVDKLYSGYGEATMENQAYYSSQHRMQGAFPQLDKIKKAYITSGK